MTNPLGTIGEYLNSGGAPLQLGTFTFRRQPDGCVYIENKSGEAMVIGKAEEEQLDKKLQEYWEGTF